MGIESVNTMLEYYNCPPGYCRCTKVENTSDDVCNNVYYYDNDDLQCVCDREGRKICTYMYMYNYTYVCKLKYNVLFVLV